MFEFLKGSNEETEKGQTLILGFHSVSFTKNATLKKQGIVLGKSRAAKAPVELHLCAWALGSCC